MLSLVLAALTAAPAPPSPLQYYSQALATMQRLPQPPHVSFETIATARGIGIAQPCQKGKIEWTLSFGSHYLHQLGWHATYASDTDDEVIHTTSGETCRGPATVFDRLTWRGAYAWVRHGIFSQAPPAATQTNDTHVAPAPLKTIADVSVIAPGAYRVSDGGSQSCPSGSPGHALRFDPRFDSTNHPLRDAIVETRSMRICMIRFNLGTYQAAGTGFRGDLTLDFGDVGGDWLVTSGHAAMALRGVGISLKSIVVDFRYASVTFPASAVCTPDDAQGSPRSNCSSRSARYRICRGLWNPGYVRNGRSLALL